MGFLAHIVVTAVLIYVLGQLIDGIRVRGAGPALIGALVLGLANAIVRPILVLLTLPATILTLGLFLLVINALMLMIAAAVVPGFEVRGFRSALWGAVLLAVMNFVVARVFI
jgi:putative membrane protein